MALSDRRRAVLALEASKQHGLRDRRRRALASGVVAAAPER